MAMACSSDKLGDDTFWRRTTTKQYPVDGVVRSGPTHYTYKLPTPRLAKYFLNIKA
jgi:hypothetical protein